MVQDIWFFLSILFPAILLGTTLTHTVEMRSKLSCDRRQWLATHRMNCPADEPIATPMELAAIAASVIFAYIVSGDPVAFVLAVLGTLCFAVAFFGVQVFVTNRVNAAAATWTPESMPPDWHEWRTRAEYSHAARFVLQLAGFIILLTAFFIHA